MKDFRSRIILVLAALMLLDQPPATVADQGVVAQNVFGKRQLGITS